MLRDGYNVQFEGTIIRTTHDAALLRETGNVPRDQGWSWVVLFAAFLTMFIANGIHASFGIFYSVLIAHFDSGRSETAWIGSISMGVLCFFSPVASVLVEHLGCRITSIIGAFLASLGFLITSFANGIALLYFSHGVLYGLGTSLTYIAAMTVVTRSFERRRNIATGLCASGSQFGGISLAPLSQVLFDRLGYANTFRLYAGLMLVVALSSFVYRPDVARNTSQPTTAKKSPWEMLNVWRSKQYIVWALGTTMVTLGYNIPRYFLAKYASDEGISKDASAWLVSYLCASSAIGRIMFGRLCERCPKLQLCQVCIIGCVIPAFLYPFLKSYAALVITVVIFGLPDGGFIASLCLVTTEIVGMDKMAEGFGFMLFCQSYANVIGPPLAGMLYDTYKSYEATFIFAAVPEIIGALLLFLIPYYQRNQVRYTHEIAESSNSGMLDNVMRASTLNPISETPILPTIDTQGEFNVVINLTSDDPNLRLLNVVINKVATSEADDEMNNADSSMMLNQNDVISNVEQTSIPAHLTEITSCIPAVFPTIMRDVVTTEVMITEPRDSILSADNPRKNSSTQTVIYDTNIETATAVLNNDDMAQDSIPSSNSYSTQVSTLSRDHDETLIIDISSDCSHPDQTINQLSSIENNTSHKSMQESASVIRVTSSIAGTRCDGHGISENVVMGTDGDTIKLPPPPKHHVKDTRIRHTSHIEVGSYHDNELDKLPDVALVELIPGTDMDNAFSSDAKDNPVSLMDCTSLESRFTNLNSGLPGMEVGSTQIEFTLDPDLYCLDSGLTCEIQGFKPDTKSGGASEECGPTRLESGFTGLAGLDPVLNQNQDSLMLVNFPTDVVNSPLFSADSSRMSKMSDIFTTKQLPKPLKPTSVSALKDNDEQETQANQEVALVSSPLSCELSTVIADVIQSLTSQQSTKCNKESNISESSVTNRETGRLCNDEKVDVVEPSNKISSSFQHQSSVLHSIQSIVAQGCPEDVSLFDDISIDLTLDKDPSYDSIVVIDDTSSANFDTSFVTYNPPLSPPVHVAVHQSSFHADSFLETGGVEDTDITRPNELVYPHDQEVSLDVPYPSCDDQEVSLDVTNHSHLPQCQLAQNSQNNEVVVSDVIECHRNSYPVTFLDLPRNLEPSSENVSSSTIMSIEKGLSTSNYVTSKPNEFEHVASSLTSQDDDIYELEVLISSPKNDIFTEECQVVETFTNSQSTVFSQQNRSFNSSVMEPSNIISKQEEEMSYELTLNPDRPVLLHDAIVLEIFPHNSSQDSGNYIAPTPNDQLTKSIEPTNPFYQDIQQ